MMNTKYNVIKSRYITEKSNVLSNLKNAVSNPSVRKCESPKYVFLVDIKANKTEIAQAIEEIYADKKITVKSVNTINMKPKKRIVRGRIGFKKAFKKAVVTLARGDKLDDEN